MQVADPIQPMATAGWGAPGPPIACPHPMRKQSFAGNLRAVRLAGKDVAGAAAGTVLAGNNAAAAGPSSSSPAKTAHPNRALTVKLLLHGQPSDYSVVLQNPILHV